MPDLDHAAVLLRLAVRDNQTLAAIGDSEAFCDETFGFHAQQASEKALKAWLCLYGIQYPHTHDLGLLYKLLKDVGARDIKECEPLIDLSDFAVQYRYDTYDDEPVDRNGIGNLVPGLTGHIERLMRQQGRSAKTTKRREAVVRKKKPRSKTGQGLRGRTPELKRGNP